jgi:Zn-dependent protease with chaperone function
MNAHKAIAYLIIVLFVAGALVTVLRLRWSRRRERRQSHERIDLFREKD